MRSTMNRLIAHCKGFLASYKIPKQFIILTELPKTHVGKIDKNELLRLAVKGVRPYWLPPFFISKITAIFHVSAQLYGAVADRKSNGIFNDREAGNMVGHIGGANGTQQIGETVKSAAPDKGVVVAAVQSVSVQNEQQKGEERELPVQKAQQMTDSMNKFLESVNTQLRFKLHDELKEYYVTIVDSNTDEVVREIPSKKLMDIYASMKEFVGLLIDRKI